MAKAVLDTTVLVSALLNPNPGGVSYEVLRLAAQGTFDLFLSADILQETAETLRQSRLKQRYAYSDADVAGYCDALASLAAIVSEVPPVRVVRDPADDMIVACALAAGADYLVTRDKDLLSIGMHAGVAIVTPESFLRIVRAQ